MHDCVSFVAHREEQGQVLVGRRIWEESHTLWHLKYRNKSKVITVITVDRYLALAGVPVGLILLSQQSQPR